MERMEAGSNSSSLSSYDVFTTRFLLAMITSALCCLFCVINSAILMVLCSKPAFSQCPRYVLLFNLVFADTVLMVQAQILYLLATYWIYISYHLCIGIAMMSYTIGQISPYTLIFMSLERCVAVCFPFKHTVIVTLRNTFYTLLLIWTVSCLDVFIRIMLFLEFPFQMLPDFQMKQFCSDLVVVDRPRSKVYNTVFTYFLFILSALIVFSSFVAVMVVACLASEDRAQAEKTRNTLLLHLFQLGLNLLSVMNSHLFVAVATCCGKGSRLFVVVYVSAVLMPRCLSSLAYGLRDPAIRLVLVKYLFLRRRAREVHVKGLVLQSKHKPDFKRVTPKQ